METTLSRVDDLPVPRSAMPGTPASPDSVAVYLASLAPSGRAAVLRLLHNIAHLLEREPATIEWHQFRYQHITTIKTMLTEQGKAPATINLAVYALKGIAREAWNAGLISAEDYTRIRALRPVRGERLPTGRAATPGELDALLKVCTDDTSPAGLRDAAIIALLYASGLRRPELASLRPEYFNPEDGSLRVHKAKGNKQRIVYLTGGAAQILADWLKWRGRISGVLFLPLDKRGNVTHDAMTAQAIYNALDKRARQAGIMHLSPHDFRRTFVGDLLDAGIDIATVSRLADHANVQTTARYDRRSETAKKKAAQHLHVPYKRRKGEQE